MFMVNKDYHQYKLLIQVVRSRNCCRLENHQVRQTISFQTDCT